MRLGVLLLAAALGWLACGVAAAIPPTLPSRAPDVQDLVFLGDARPVHIRLHIDVNGKPFQYVWEDYIRLLFAYLDRDGNGILTKAEAERAPSAQQLLQMMRGNILGVDVNKSAPFSEMDVDPIDGMVTVQKLAAYYRRLGAGPLQSISGQATARSEALNKVLFKHLDANNDGKLSKEELSAAASVLRRFDYDDDEMISEQELLPAQGSAMTAPQVVSRVTPRQANPGASFYVISPEDRVSHGLPAQLLKKYDKDKNELLSPAEIGLEQSVFDWLDVNHDGQLDAAELAKYVTGPPDIEISAHLGRLGQKPGVQAMSKGLAPMPGVSLQPAANGALLVTLTDEQIGIDVRPETAPYELRTRGVRQFYMQQFQIADSEKKGYLLLSQLMGQFQFLRAIFTLADRDGDGKLTMSELVAFLDVQEKAIQCPTGLEIQTSGRGLFALLDANRDGRLGLRELRTGWSRLSSWDRNHDGLIAASELPQQFHLRLGRGQANFGLGMEAMAATSASGIGPLWFRKMDRNGDGDVSPREFLGTLEDFRKIDTDGDGLIDAQEAAAAAKWFKPK